MRRLLEAQRRAFETDPPPSLAVRRSRMDRLLAALLNNVDALADALGADSGQRSRAATMATRRGPRVAVQGDVASALWAISRAQEYLAFPAGVRWISWTNTTCLGTL
jgi:hypothetical protein